MDLTDPNKPIRTIARLNERAHSIVLPVWSRQDFESDQEWSLFERYRALPALTRSATALYEACPEAHNVDLVKLEKWHFWAERAAEYERHLDRETVGAVVLDRTVAAVRREQLNSIEGMHRLLSGEIKVWLRKQARLAEQGGDVTLFSAHEMIRALREVVLLGRLVMGESTENVSLNVPLDKLTDQELAFLTEIQRKFSGESIVTVGEEKLERDT